VTVEEAIGHVIQALKQQSASQFGYDYYPPHVATQVAFKDVGHQSADVDRLTAEYYPHFQEAGWLLCMRGVLLPGVHTYQAQSVSDGGYSLTVAGAEQLDNLDETTGLIYRSGSLQNTFREFADLFGDAFQQRALEAIACRDAGVWLASCVMSGAAAEAVLLAIAIAKTKNEDEVLTIYRRAKGRRDVLNVIIGQAQKHRKDTLKAFTGIIAAWRDEAGHGAATKITTANADEALRQLLHMCQWTRREWEALVA